MSKQTVIRVCSNTSCKKRGAAGVMKKIEEAAGGYDLDYCGCLGCCDFGPNLLVNDNLVIGVNKENVMGEIAKALETATPTPEEKEADLDKVINNLI